MNLKHVRKHEKVTAQGKVIRKVLPAQHSTAQHSVGT